MHVSKYLKYFFIENIFIFYLICSVKVQVFADSDYFFIHFKYQ